jgi:hypothetical protein
MSAYPNLNQQCIDVFRNPVVKMKVLMITILSINQL